MSKKNSNTPLVSIIIPVYNGEEYLKEAIDSALAQTYKNIEIIVINDGSTDSSEEVAMRYGSRIRYFRKDNGGVATALNYGIRKSKGMYISWLSHDDVYLPNKLKSQIDLLLEQKALQKTIIFSNFSEIDHNGKKIRDVILPEKLTKNIRTFLSIECDYYMQGCTLLIPKYLFDKYGLFDQSKECTQDYYMWFKLASYANFVNSNLLLVNTRIHPKQTSFKKADEKLRESDILRSYCINELSLNEFRNHTDGISYYWTFYYRYKNGGYIHTPTALLNKMHSAYGEKSLVSVIVPVYNVEGYVKECIESIIQQNFLNFELILINDGSTDGSGLICDEYSKEYPKFVKTINIKNSGLGNSRNIGITHANGEYICFIDSDDYIAGNMLEQMYKKAKEGYDVVMCEYYTYDDKKKKIVGKYEFPKDIDYSSIPDVVKNSTLKIVPCAWNKIFRKKLLSCVPFGSSVFEDIQAIPVYLSFAKKVAITREALYYYRVNRKGSIVDSAKKNNSTKLSFVESWEILLKKGNKKYIKEITYATYVHINDILQVFPRYLDEGIKFINKYSEQINNNKYIKDDIDKGIMINWVNKNVIPKKIHYFWFGRNSMSNGFKKCYESWKMFAPDYDIIKWDESNCNIEENAYVKEAYASGKWAFVSDYFRFKIINKYGGFYVDTDVEIHKSLDALRLNLTFFGFEKKDFVNAAIFGSVPNSRILVEILNSFNDERLNKNSQDRYQTIPYRITKILLEKYNLSLNGGKQVLRDGITIYPVNILTLNVHDGGNIAEHHFDYTWQEDEPIIPYKHYLLKEYFKNIHEDSYYAKNIITKIKKISIISILRIIRERIKRERKVLYFVHSAPLVGPNLARIYLRFKKILNAYEEIT